MKTTQVPNQPEDPEAEPTMRALDPFFETGDLRDHANQWDVSALWPERAAEAKKSKPDADLQ